MSFKKKSVYHSELAAAGDIYITVTSAALTSKFKPAGEAGHKYVEFEYDGNKHQYIAETEDCADQLGAHKGQSITIRASGRNEDAEIRVVGPTGQPSHQPAPQARQPAQQPSQQPPHPKEAVYTKARVLAAKTAVLYGICVQAAESVVKLHPVLETNDSVSNAQIIKEIATHFSIKLEREGVNLKELPVAHPHEAPKPTPTPPEPDPEPEEEDDIPFNHEAHVPR